MSKIRSFKIKPKTGQSRAPVGAAVVVMGFGVVVVYKGLKFIIRLIKIGIQIFLRLMILNINNIMKARFLDYYKAFVTIVPQIFNPLAVKWWSQFELRDISDTFFASPQTWQNFNKIYVVDQGVFINT